MFHVCLQENYYQRWKAIPHKKEDVISFRLMSCDKQHCNNLEGLTDS